MLAMMSFCAAANVLTSEASSNLRSYPLPFSVYEHDNTNEVAGGYLVKIDS